MRIGLFTDSYFPSTNGIVFVVEILRNNLEQLGHDVYVVAPEPRPRHWFRRREHRVVRFPAVEGLFFEEQLTSFFFPSRQLKKINELDLEVIVIFTPGQIGLMGAYAALQSGIPLVEQYCTDLVAYVKRYPAVLPAVFALLLSSPVALKVRPKELANVTKALTLRRDKSMTFGQDTVKHALNLLHQRCDLIVAVSEKSAKMIEPYGGSSPIVSIPTGVDALPIREQEVAYWRKRWRANQGSVVFLYVGRLSKEKNIELLIHSFCKVADRNDTVRLVIVGSFSHDEVLKALVNESAHREKIIFTGRIARERLGSVYASADVFCFPSVTDTQALVINEAAHANLPIIWCDQDVNNVAKHEVSGLLAKQTVVSFSAAMEKLLRDDTLRHKLGKMAQKRAQQFTELRQTKALVKALRNI